MDRPACVGVERGGTGVAIFEFLLQKKGGGADFKNRLRLLLLCTSRGRRKATILWFFLQQIDTPPFSRPHPRPIVMCRKDK